MLEMRQGTTYQFCLPVHLSFIEQVVKRYIVREVDIFPVEPELVFYVCRPKPGMTWPLVLVLRQNFKSQALCQVMRLWGFQYQPSFVNADRVKSTSALAVFIQIDFVTCYRYAKIFLGVGFLQVALPPHVFTLHLETCMFSDPAMSHEGVSKQRMAGGVSW